MSAAPVRAVRLQLDLQGDTPADVVNALEELARRVYGGELSAHGVSGGYHSGYIYSYDAATTPTHDDYVAAITAWAQRALKTDQGK